VFNQALYADYFFKDVERRVYAYGVTVSNPDRRQQQQQQQQQQRVPFELLWLRPMHIWQSKGNRHAPALYLAQHRMHAYLYFDGHISNQPHESQKHVMCTNAPSLNYLALALLSIVSRQIHVSDWMRRLERCFKGNNHMCTKCSLADHLPLAQFQFRLARSMSASG
jgi:hypothetical protein